MISHCEDGGRPLPGWVGRHMRRCTGCQGFHRSVSEMQRILAADAPACDPEQEVRLARRVAAVVERGSGADERIRSYRGSPGPLRRSGWILATAASIAAAALMIAYLMNDDAGEESPQAGDPAAAIERLVEIPKDLFVSVDTEPAAWLSAVAQPLTEEVDRLSADASMIGSFLQTFLAVEIIRSRDEPDRNN
jgi:hypothetical protein